MTALTQADQILSHLRDKGPLTPLGALKLCGCLRLSGRIYDLKRKGHRIITEYVPVGRRNPKHVASYRLVETREKRAA